MKQKIKRLTGEYGKALNDVRNSFSELGIEFYQTKAGKLKAETELDRIVLSRTPRSSCAANTQVRRLRKWAQLQMDFLEAQKDGMMDRLRDVSRDDRRMWSHCEGSM